MSPHVGNFPREYPKPLAIPPSAFVPNLDTQDWNIRDGYVGNRAALTQQNYFAPVYLPDGVTVNKLTLHGYRDDADAVMTLGLHRNNREGGLETLASVTADWITGYSSKSDEAIDYPVIDNENYDYSLELILDPNDDVLDVRFAGALIDWN